MVGWVIEMQHVTARVIAMSTVRRLILFAGLWVLLTEGNLGTWYYAVVLVPLAVATSLVLLPPRRRARQVAHRALATLGLAGWFLARSFIGGLDVARRAVLPGGEVEPDYVRCPMRLPRGAGQIAVANVMNLMPGSLAVSLSDDEMTVHVLDPSIPAARTVQHIEDRIAKVAGLALG